MKKISFIIKFTFISSFIFALTWSCEEKVSQSEESLLTRSIPNDKQMNLDTTFLGFEGDLFNPRLIWENMSVYSLAYDRMIKHVKIINNQLTWDFKTAAELNISQNIYDYVTFMWKLENKKLNSGNYTIEANGIYFIIRAKSPGIMPLTGQILTRGNHNFNLTVCLGIVRNVTSGWLGNYIDFENSEMIPDGYGGWYIDGSGKTGKGTFFYYATNVCPKNPECDLNYITTNNSYDYGSGFVEMVMNKQHAPLVTVQILS